MAVLDPRTVELKKNLLGATSQTKVEGLAAQTGVPTHPAIAAAEAENARIDERIQAFDTKQENAWVQDSELNTPTGLLKQGVARFAETLPSVMSRGSTWYLDAEAAKRAATMDPRAVEIARQMSAYEEEQALIKDYKTSIFKDSMAGRITPAEANEKLLTVEQQALNDLRTKYNDPERGFTEPLSDEQNAFLDTVPEVDPSGKARPFAPTTTHREKLQAYRDVLDKSADRREFWDGLKPEGIANPKRSERFAKFVVPEVLDESGARENFGRAGKAFEQEEYGTVAKELFHGVRKAALPGIAAVLENPATAFEELFGSVLPEALMFANPAGAVTGGLSTAGYAGQIFTDGVKAYEEKHGKNSLTPEDATEIAAWSAAAGALNFASTGVLSRPLRALPLSPKVKEVVDGVAKSLDEAPALARLPGKAAVGTGRRGGAALAAGGVEGTAETGQTAIEENLSQLNTDFDAEKLTTAGLLGFGGGLTASAPAVLSPGKALDKAADGARKRMADRAEKEASKRTADEQFDRAVKTGDVAPMLNPEGSQYAPGRAAEALVKRTLDEDVSAEDKAKHIQQVAEISQQLEEEQEVLKPLADVPALKQRLTAIQERLAALPEDSENRERFETAAKTIQEHIDNAPQIQERLTRVEQEIARVQGAELLLEGDQPRIQDSDVDALISQVEQAATPVAEGQENVPSTQPVEAAQQIMSLAMERPDTLSDDALDRLVSNENNVLDTTQRETLRKLSAARQAQNALKSLADVQEDVLVGGKDFVGLSQYQSRVAKRLARGDRAGAQNQVDQLRKLQRSHARKLSLLQDATASIARLSDLPEKGSSNGAIYLIRDNDAPDGWRLKRTKPEGWDPEENGGRTLWRSKQGQRAANALKDAVAVEVEAINRTLDYLQTSVEQHGSLTAPKASPAPQPATEDVTQVEEAQAAPETAESAVEESPVVVAEAPVEAAVEPEPEPEPVVEAQETEESPAAPEETVAEDPEVTEVTQEAEETTPATEESLSLDDELAQALAAAPEEVEYEAGSLPGINEASNLHKGNLTLQQLRGDSAKGVPRTNQVLAYFKQALDEARPLVAMKDFMSLWAEVPKLFQNFLPEKTLERLTEGQEVLVGKFQGFFKKADAFLVRNMDRKDQATFKFAYKDWTYYLNELGEEGTLAPENVRAAIALSAFTWASEEAAGNGISTPDQIRAQLGLDKNEHLDAGAILALYKAGTLRRFVQRNLGRRARQALGLKAHADAPVNAEKQLELALGNQALALLHETGWIEEHVVDGSYFPQRDNQANEAADLEDTAQETNTTKRVGAPPNRPFIRIRRDDKNRVKSKALADLAEATRGNSTALTNLFKVDPDRRYVAIEPGLWDQEKIKGTHAKIPPELQKILKEASKRPHHVAPRMVQVIQAMPRELLKQSLGYVPTDSNALIHADNLPGVEARNAQIERDLDYLLELIDELSGLEGGLESAIYFIGQVWQVQRVGLASNTVNPQTSKLQRPFITMADWAVDLDPNNSPPELLQVFERAVAQGLGIKVEKLHINKVLQKLQDKLALPEIEAAVAALTKVVTGETVDDSDHQAIQAGIEVGEKGGHSLQVLVEWAAYQAAKDKGETFTTALPLEVDGLANGPALAHLMLGLVDANLGEKFGFYTEKSGLTSVADWKQHPASQDLYETMMVSIGHALAEAQEIDPTFRDTLNLLGELIDPETGLASSAGRNFTKPIVTPVGFGASITKVLKNTADAFIDTFSESMEAIAKDSDLTAQGRLEKMQSLVKEWNRVLLGGRNPIWVPRTIQEGLGYVREGGQPHEATRLSQQQRGAIRAHFSDAISPHIKDALNTNFSEFFAARAMINKASNYIFEVYQQAYDALREYKLRQRAHEGSLPRTLSTDAKGNKIHIPLQDLTQRDLDEIEQILAPIFPRVHTPLSKSTSSEAAGLEMLKRSTSQPPRYFKEAYSAGTVMSASPEISRSGIKQGSKPTRPKKYEGIAEYDMLVEPGAATSVVMTHATDSAIASRTYGEIPAMNIHDGEMFGLQDALKGAQKLNQNTFEVLLNYSQPLELLATWDRVLDNLQAIKKQVPGFDPKISLLKARRKAFAEFAYQAEWNKLSYLMQVAVIDQYSMEGGAYQVTAADKAKLQERMDAIKAGMDKEGIKPGRKPVSAKVVPVQVRVAKAQQEAAQTASKPAQAVPQPEVSVQAVTEAQWESVIKNAGTAKRLISAIAKHVPPSMRPLAGALARHPLAQTLAVRLADGLAPPGIQQDQSSLGKATVENGQVSAVYLWPGRALEWGGSFGPVVSILHELVHAVTVPALRLNDKLADTARRMDKRLYHKQNPALQAEMLLQHVQDWVKENQDSLTKEEAGEVAQATTNRFELLAWGSTSPVFQQVLQRIPGMTNKKSVFDSLIELFLKALGLGSNHQSALRDVFRVVSRAANASSKAAKTQSRDTTHLAMARPDNSVQQMTVEQVYDALAQGSHRVTDPKHDRNLRNALAQVVKTVYGAEGIVPGFALKEATAEAMDTLFNAILGQSMPFASRAIGRVLLNNQEKFVLESVEVTAREALQHSQITRDELRRLFNDARDQIGPEAFFEGDWSQATDTEREKAEDIHNFIFTLERNEDNSSDFLSRFVALGIAYAPLQQALAKVKPKAIQAAEKATLWQRLATVWDQLMRALAQKMTGTTAEDAGDRRLVALTKNLARIEAKHKAAVEAQRSTATHVLADAMGSLSTRAYDKLRAFGESPLIKESGLAPIRLAGTVSRILGGQKVDEIITGLQTLRNKENPNQKLGFLSEVVNEIKGAQDDTMVFYKLLQVAKKREQDRKYLADTHSRVVREKFLKLTDRESAALTQAVLRTDMVALLGVHTAPELVELLKNSRKREAVIKGLEQQLQQEQHFDFYVTQARGLGYQMVTGRTRRAGQLQNAYAIARLFGQNQTGPTGKQAQDIESKVDQLASLYALKYLPSAARMDSLRAIEREMARTDGNGFSFLLRLHENLKAEAKEQLFANSPEQLVKGYTRDLVNPHIQVVAVSMEEGKVLKQAGYTLGVPLKKDAADPEPETQYLYAIDGLGLDPMVTTTMSYTGARMRGTKVHAGLTSSRFDGLHQKNFKTTQRIQKIHQQRERNYRASTFDPSEVKENFMAPVINHAGEVVNHRYLMTDDTKDTVLERMNSIDQVVGALAASTFDKVSSESLNKKVIEALHEQYKAELGKNSEAYVEVSETSQDPQIQEIYRLLPESTKKEIRKVWGTNRMMVRNDILLLTFGYRKLSIANVLDKRGEHTGNEFRDATRDLFIKTLAAVFAWDFRSIEEGTTEDAVRLLKARIRLKNTENLWEGLVSMTKDNVVIKNFFTLWGNQISNMTFLYLMGVPVKDIVKHSVVGLKGVLSYQRDRDELARLKLDLEAELLSPRERARSQQRVIELQDALQKNPVNSMVEAGMLQSIVEDVTEDNDPFSFKSRLMQKVEHQYGRLPTGVQKAGRFIAVTHDTSLYKLLHKSTTLSDFIARYAVIQHMTTRAKNPMSLEDAQQFAVKAFVNYDLPTHPNLQKANDLGAVFFTKYYLRIQTVLLQVMQDNPGKTMAMALLANMLPTFPFINEVGFWNRLNNPFDWGALKYPDSVGELIPLQMGAALLSD